jgi:hypothetical protein
LRCSGEPIIVGRLRMPGVVSLSAWRRLVGCAWVVGESRGSAAFRPAMDPASHATGSGHISAVAGRPRGDERATLAPFGARA